MSETATSKAARKAIKRLFPQVRLTRMQAGTILKRGGGRVHCADEGWPDSVGYLPDGRFLAIEFKAPGGKISKKQQERIDDAISCNCVVIVADSVYDCLVELKKILEAIK